MAHLRPQSGQRLAWPPLVVRLQVNDGLGHVQRGGVGGGVGPRDFRHDVLDFRERHERGILLRRNPGVLLEGDAWVRDRHEHQVAFVQRRHELVADATRDKQRPGEEERGGTGGEAPVRERPGERRTVQPAQGAHHRVVLFAVHLPAEQQTAQDRHERHRDDGRREHRKGLGERERVKQLPFLTGQREDGDEREQDDRHRKEHGSADEPRRFEHRVPDTLPVARIDGALFHEPEGVLGDDNPGIHEDANRNGDPGKTHDVRR